MKRWVWPIKLIRRRGQGKNVWGAMGYFFRRLWVTGRRRLSRKTRLKMRAQLKWNLAAFMIVIGLMWLIAASKGGQEALNLGLDKLVKADYKAAVLEGQDPRPVSERLRLVIFDRHSYDASYTKGLWTPRDELGHCILSLIKAGAEVVMVDFSFDTEAPVVLVGDQPRDGDASYLSSLREAAELARLNEARIIVPHPGRIKKTGHQYLEVIESYPDVFIPANFQAWQSPDQRIRRFSWLGYDLNSCPVLAANLTAFLAAEFKSEKTKPALREAKRLVTGLPTETNLLPSELRQALAPNRQDQSSRLIFRLLPREIVAGQWADDLEAMKKEGRAFSDPLKGVVWRPEQLKNSAPPSFAGKIVLIGSDYAGNGDYHQSAFGEIAGSYLLANSVNQLLTNKLSYELKWLNTVFLLVIGLAGCLIYAALPLGPASLIFFVSPFAAAFISKWIFIHYGVFFDVWLPFIGVGLCNTIVSWRNWRTYWGGSGLLQKFLKR